MTTITKENYTATIYASIKQKLMRGEMEPGERLKLGPLVQEFGISQTPVREALLQMVSERILLGQQGRPIQVPVLTLEELTEIRAIRLNLEVMATRAAVPRIQKKTITTMANIHRKMMNAKAFSDRSKTLQLNYDFHFELYQSSQMPVLLGLLESLWARTGPSLRALYQAPFFHMPGKHPHEMLLEALAKGDVQAAVSALELDVGGHGLALMERLGAAAA